MLPSPRTSTIPSVRPRRMQANRRRHDVEGLDDIDIHAMSTQSYKRWVQRLSKEQFHLLSLFRGGAARSPTRLQCFACPLCSSSDLPSLRHFWASCPALAVERRRITRKFQVPVGWWKLQPRGTAKSGWITLSAAAQPERRGALQAAACEMGISCWSCLGFHVASGTPRSCLEL